MAYPDDVLVEGEQVVLHEHPHWKVVVVPVLALLAVVGFLTFVASAVQAREWAPWAWLVLGVAGLALVGWLTVVPVVRWRTTHFVVTTRRVLVREGVLTRRGIDIPISRINSVQFRHSVFERLVGCGTLIVESASDEPLEFDDVPHPERVQTILYSEVADEQR